MIFFQRHQIHIYNQNLLPVDISDNNDGSSAFSSGELAIMLLKLNLKFKALCVVCNYYNNRS